MKLKVLDIVKFTAFFFLSIFLLVVSIFAILMLEPDLLINTFYFLGIENDIFALWIIIALLTMALSSFIITYIGSLLGFKKRKKLFTMFFVVGVSLLYLIARLFPE